MEERKEEETNAKPQCHLESTTELGFPFLGRRRRRFLFPNKL